MKVFREKGIFGPPIGMAGDFILWLNMDTWHYEDAMCLLVGTLPRPLFDQDFSTKPKEFVDEQAEIDHEGEFDYSGGKSQLLERVMGVDS